MIFAILRLGRTGLTAKCLIDAENDLNNGQSLQATLDKFNGKLTAGLEDLQKRNTVLQAQQANLLGQKDLMTLMAVTGDQEFRQSLSDELKIRRDELEQITDGELNE